MKNRNRSLLLVAGLLLCAFNALQAQQITFTAVVDRNSISVGENIKLVVTLANANGRCTDPDLGGLELLGPPQPMMGSQTINGRFIPFQTRTYFLTASKPGDYVIGPATARIGNGEIKTDPIKVHVEKSTTSGGALLDQLQRGSRDLFIALSLNKSKAYVGEQVVATWTLYSRVADMQQENIEMPAFTGCWSETVPMGSLKWDDQRKTINGLSYYTVSLHRVLLVPQKSGSIKIDQATFPFIANSSDLFRRQRVIMKSNVATLEAIQLPPGAPADFSGAVGNIDLEVKASPLELKANEAIDMSVRISGNANLKLVDAPKLQLPGDLESYDPKVVDKLNVTAGGMSGAREFQFLVIPRHEGDYAIPPITLSYFDLNSKSYRTLSSDTLHLHVAKGEGNAAVISRPNQRNVEQVDKDIRFVRTGDLLLRKKNGDLFGTWPYLAGIALPMLGFLALLGWNMRRQRALGDVQGMRRKGADKVARQRLRTAAEAIKADDRTAFYQALGKALEGYFADKFNLGVVDVNANMVKEKLGTLDEGRTAAEYADLMGVCELARFAPFESKPRQQLYDEAAALIGRIESQVPA